MASSDVPIAPHQLSRIWSCKHDIVASIIIIIIDYGGCEYRSVPGKRPLPGKRPCTEFQGVTVAAPIQTYGIYIAGKRPCGLKSQVMFKRPWVLTRDATVIQENTLLLAKLSEMRSSSYVPETLSRYREHVIQSNSSNSTGMP